MLRKKWHRWNLWVYIPLNSYPCKYETTRKYKIAATDAVKLSMLYFNNCVNKIKTKEVGKLEKLSNCLNSMETLVARISPIPGPGTDYGRSQWLWFHTQSVSLPVTPVLVSGFLPCPLGPHFWLIPQFWELHFPFFFPLFWDWNPAQFLTSSPLPDPKELSWITTHCLLVLVLITAACWSLSMCSSLLLLSVAGPLCSHWTDSDSFCLSPVFGRDKHFLTSFVC